MGEQEDRCANCGCAVKINHLETKYECLKTEVGWMRKLMIGNLVTGLFILAGVIANLIVWMARTPPVIP